jgi:DNA-binding ferritin-like protein (Dps family)
LHVVLKESEETVFARPLSPIQQERLKAIGDGCHHVLEDLEKLVKKYESLGTQSQRTWDRLRWSAKDVAELRARLTSHITLLTAYISCVAPHVSCQRISLTLIHNESLSTSQANVEKKLDRLLQECRDGKRQGSVISTQTVDSLSMDERQVWRAIRKELEDIGITLDAFEANKHYIFEWFVKALESGAFEDQSNEPLNGNDNNLIASRPGSH